MASPSQAVLARLHGYARKSRQSHSNSGPACLCGHYQARNDDPLVAVSMQGSLVCMEREPEASPAEIFRIRHSRDVDVLNRDGFDKRTCMHSMHCDLPQVGGRIRQRGLGAAIACRASQLCANYATVSKSTDISCHNLVVSSFEREGRAA